MAWADRAKNPTLAQKRGKPWGPDEEAILWKLRRRGMEFDVIAVSAYNIPLVPLPSLVESTD